VSHFRPDDSLQTNVSRGSRQGASDLGGDFDPEEIRRAIEVVLPTLVDDSDIAILGPVLVGQDTIGLVELKGHRAVPIVDAYGKDWLRLSIFFHRVSPDSNSSQDSLAVRAGAVGVVGDAKPTLRAGHQDEDVADFPADQVDQQ
jgi:hypothetical protein